MTRKNIFEILKKEINIPDELNKITKLFNSKMIYNEYNIFGERYTFEEIFEKKIFSSWKQRNTFISCKEIREKLEIPKIFTVVTSIDLIVTSLEYYCNIIYLVDEKIIRSQTSIYSYDDKIKILEENINILLDKLNHQKIINKKEDILILVPKKPAVTAVAEISSQKISFAILKYNHATMKGDLEGKRNLLNSIYIEYEPLLNSSLDNYNDFLSQTRGLFNNLNARHNNKTKENNKNTVIDLNDKELENWYDELYQLFLFCVLIKDNLERKAKVKEFLKSIKKKK